MFNNKWFSFVLGSGLTALLLVGLLTAGSAFAQGGGMMGNGSNGGRMMDGSNQYGFGPGWMMQNTWGVSNTIPFGPGMMGNFFNGGGGFGGMMGGGMMVNANNPFYIAPQPLTPNEASAVLTTYVADLNDANLAYKDVMIFDNHTYAQIIEKDSGIGAMEVIIDPTTKIVYPEMGPNMMWNQKYGMMSGYGHYGMMRGMMGGYFNGPNNTFNFGNTDSPAELTITPEQAVTAAQSYLDTNFAAAGLTADDHADPFYGYYTLHVVRDGETVGMLGVNGYNGAVWPHTWHGRLLEVSME